MSSSIAIITDTDCSLPDELSRSLVIHQVPITVQFGDEVFETGVNINDASLFERIDRENRLPTTAAPAPAKFSAAFQQAFEKGAELIICLCVSSTVSATHDNAVLAAREDTSGRDITIIDTLSLTMGQGFIVLAAAEAVQQGASKEEIIALVDDVRQRSHLYAALSTLKYLAMSGRVGKLAAGFAGLLNVKPILTIQDGKLEMLERVRTRNKSLVRTLELSKEKLGENDVSRMAIVHVNALSDAREFEQQLRANMPCPEEILYAELTPGLSVHTGTGLLGVAFVSE